MRRFNSRYLWLAGGLLLVEVIIARWAHDRVVRPYGGDLLATILVYCLLRGWGPCAPYGLRGALCCYRT